MSKEQSLQQTVAHHDCLIKQLRSDIDRIISNNRKKRQFWNVSPNQPDCSPASTSRFSVNTRQAIKNRINDYCGHYQVNQADTYTYLYKRLGEVWNINVHQLIRINGESMLDTVERYGCLDKLLSLAMAELKYPEWTSDQSS